MEKSKRITEAKLLLYLEQKFFLTESTFCPKAQCLKLSQVYFAAYGIPSTQKKLHRMLCSKDGGGVGNIDLNRRCLICAYRAYRMLYNEENGRFPGSDVADDFDMNTIPEEDAPEEPEEVFSELQNPTPKRRGSLGGLQEVFIKIQEVMIRNNGGIFSNFLFAHGQSSFEKFSQLAFQNSFDGTFAMNIIFVPTDAAMRDLIERVLHTGYKNVPEFWEMIVGHVMKHVKFCSLDNSQNEEDNTTYTSINDLEFHGMCKRKYINIEDEIEGLQIVKIVDVPIVPEMKKMFPRSKRIYSDRVILLFVNGFLVERKVSSEVMEKIFRV